MHFCLLFTFSSLSLSLQTPSAHSFTLYFYYFLLFVSFFLLHHRNSHQLLSSLICSSQFSSLRFLLQIQVHSFFFIKIFFYFFLPSPFFPKISLSRYEKFSVLTFRPGRNGTIFKTLVHVVSEKRKKKDIARTPKSGESYRYQYFDKNGVSVQPSEKEKKKHSH